MKVSNKANELRECYKVGDIYHVETLKFRAGVSGKMLVRAHPQIAHVLSTAYLPASPPAASAADSLIPVTTMHHHDRPRALAALEPIPFRIPAGPAQPLSLIHI